jgi:hypothetical protein
MQFVGSLAAKSNFDMLGHVLKQWMEEHDGDICIFAVPSQLGKASFKGLFLQEVLMMNEVVMGGYQFGRLPIGIVFTLSHGPAFRDRLARTLSGFVGDGGDKA